jgi:DNA modification methylase
MRNTKTPIKNLLVWVKNKGNGGLGSNYTFQHELIVFAHNIPHRNKVMMKGRKAGIKTVRGKGNVWYFNKINKAMSLKLHNAEKPVDLICYALENSTEENASVFDPFAGSGSTLIACEKTNRTFYGIEKDPYYCDIIVSRYIAATGDKRVVVSGREYSHFLGKRQE